MPITRRHFVAGAGAASLTTLLPTRVFSQGSASKKAVIHAEDEIGVVKPEFHGNFAEHLGSCTYGGIWVGEKSPVPNVNGFRKATVDYLKELGVPVLRWPGGCFADDYHWREGIGPRDNRPRRVNTNWGHYVEDNSFGLHEFIGFCKLIGAEPYLAANVGSGTPHEFRDWIEYCNFPKGSSLSDERAANGSPEPFGVRYWGVGNELWGCGGNYQPQDAAAEFRRYANFANLIGGGGFARDTGGRPVYLVGCGPSGNDARWTRGFMDQLGPNSALNGYSMHYYEGGAMQPTKFTPEAAHTQFNIFPQVERAVTLQRELLDSYDPNRRIGLILDEWGVWDQLPPEDEKRNGKLWMQATIRSGVAAGLGLNIFNRLADKLYMCNIAQLINVLQSLLLTDGPEGRNCVRTANYWAFMLFKPHRGKTAVKVNYDGERAGMPQPGGGRGGRGQGEAPPDLSVSASKQGNEMVVSLVNPRVDQTMEVSVALRGVTAKSGKARILHDADLNASNSFDNPDRLTLKPHDVAVQGGEVKVTLPPLSVVTAELVLGGQ